MRLNDTILEKNFSTITGVNYADTVGKRKLMLVDTGTWEQESSISFRDFHRNPGVIRYYHVFQIFLYRNSGEVKTRIGGVRFLWRLCFWD